MCHNAERKLESVCKWNLQPEFLNLYLEMAGIPCLPEEVWEIILSYTNLKFAPYLRISARDLAAKKIQRATRNASIYRVFPPWKEGMYVRVYRTTFKKWMIGRVACLKFDNMTPPENWAVVVMFRQPGPKLLIFLQETRHPPLRTVETSQPIPMIGPFHT